MSVIMIIFCIQCFAAENCNRLVINHSLGNLSDHLDMLTLAHKAKVSMKNTKGDATLIIK